MGTRIYFATNRNPLPNHNDVTDFGTTFSDKGLANIRFGQADVDLDKATVAIQVAPDEVSDGNGGTIFGSQTVYDQIKKDMSGQKKDTLVIIHGFNTAFGDAMVGAAKTLKAYGEDKLNVVLFSWPSNAKPDYLDYFDDRHDAQASGPAFSRGLLKLVDFLSDGVACGQKVHLLCHSMGNYVCRWALQDMIRQSPGPLPRVFENIFSMAADEDADALEMDEKWKRLPELTKHLYVYCNNHDHALNASHKTKGNPDRMGSDGPMHPLDVPSKVTIVDVSRTEGMLEALTTVGHGYYDTQPQVVADVLQVLAGVEPDLVKGRIYIPAKNRYAIGG